MSKFRKTALVEAEQFLPNEGKIPAGVYSNERADPRKNPLADWMLNTLEGPHVVRDGDYICTGPAGERWNVAQEIFEATYERVAAPAIVTAPAAGRTDADLLRLIARDHERLAPNSYHSAETLRQIADRLTAKVAQAEAACLALYEPLAWMHDNPLLLRYAGENLAVIANDLIDRAYPNLRKSA